MNTAAGFIGNCGSRRVATASAICVEHPFPDFASARCCRGDAARFVLVERPPSFPRTSSVAQHDRRGIAQANCRAMQATACATFPRVKEEYHEIVILQAS